jgi:uncharacterized membrane protein
MVQQSVTAMSYQGPIAHPDILQGYEDIVPGSAAQIIDLFDAQSRHRMDLESRTLARDNTRSWAGLFLGFVVAITVIVGGVVAVLYGHDTAGAALVTTSLASLVSVFVYGSRGQRLERIEKTKLMTGRK